MSDAAQKLLFGDSALKKMAGCVIPTYKILQKSRWGLCYISHTTDGRVTQSRNCGRIASKPLNIFVDGDW